MKYERSTDPSFGYLYEDFSAQLTFRYIAAYDDLTVTETLIGLDATKIEAWDIIDLNLAYDFGDVGRIQVGVRNVQNKLPELNRTFRQGFDSSNQDVYGRVVYTTYSINF